MRDYEDNFRCFACACYAWAARGSGRTHLLLISEGVWFLPASVWLASSSYCYWVTLITNSFIVFTSKLWVPAWLTKDRVPLVAVAVHLRGSRETWAGAWCRTGGLWVHLTPRQWWLRLWMTRRPKTRGTANAVPSPRRLRCRLLRRHRLGRRITRGRGSSSTPSWLTGVPQAGSMDSLMSGNCTPRSPKFSTSPPQRYETHPDMQRKVRIRSVGQ